MIYMQGGDFSGVDSSGVGTQSTNAPKERETTSPPGLSRIAQLVDCAGVGVQDFGLDTEHFDIGDDSGLNLHGLEGSVDDEDEQGGSFAVAGGGGAAVLPGALGAALYDALPALPAVLLPVGVTDDAEYDFGPAEKDQPLQDECNITASVPEDLAGEIHRALASVDELQDNIPKDFGICFTKLVKCRSVLEGLVRKRFSGDPVAVSIELLAHCRLLISLRDEFPAAKGAAGNFHCRRSGSTAGSKKKIGIGL